MTESQIAILLLIAFGLGVFAGYLLPTRTNREDDGDKEISLEDEPLPGQLPEEEAKEKLERTRKGYRASMSKYDQLIPWAAGGGLLVSMTLISSFAPVAPQESKWLLAFAWIFLALAIMTSIWGQYKSTRIKVYSEQFQETIQAPPDEDATDEVRDEWERSAKELRNKMRNNQKLASTLNWIAPLLLLLGFVLLGLFAVWAVPFGSNVG